MQQTVFNKENQKKSGGSDDPWLLDSIYKLRHEVFCERLGWNVNSLLGREIDEFDTEDATYGVAVADSGELEGCYRILPTTGRYMMKDVFGELLHGQPAPEDEKIMEISRFAVLPSDWQYNARQALVEITGRLLIEQIKYCLEREIELLVCVTDVRFERILRAAGLLCERYGSPIRVGKTLAVAGWQYPNEENLRSVEMAYLRNLDTLQTSETYTLIGDPIALEAAV